MGAANDRLRDLILARQSGIGRLSDREVRRLLPILSRAQRESLAKLATRLEVERAIGFDRGPATTARIRQILRETEALLATAYRQIGEQLPPRLAHLTATETSRASAAIRSAVPPEIKWPEARIPGSLVEQIASGSVVAGRRLRTYFGEGRDSLVARELRRYRNVIRESIETGILTGEPIEAIVRQIRARGATPSRNALRFVVDSAVKDVTQRARLATFKANGGEDGPVKGYQWLSTIDLRTTPEWCVPRDLLLYDLDFQPIGHSVPWLDGPGNIHPRCRSTMTAVLKSWREMGLPFREVGRGTRASMDGRVSADRSVRDRLSSSRTRLGELERVFGKQRARLLFDGDLEIGDLYDVGGRYIPVDQLTGRKAFIFLEDLAPGASLAEIKRDPTVGLSDLDVIEDVLRRQNVEYGVGWNRDGVRQLFKRGERSGVGISGIESQLIRGGTLTHNHPSAAPFSAADIQAAYQAGLREMRAVGVLADGRRVIYRMLEPDDGWLFFELKDAMEGFGTRLAELKRAGKLNPEDAHEMWVAFAEKFGIKYERIVDGVPG